MRGEGLVSQCVAHHFWVDAVEHEFGSAEHVEAVSVVNVSPCQVDEAFPALALDCGSAEIECAVAGVNDFDIEFEAGFGCVASYQLFGVLPELNTDVNVAKWCAVRLAQRRPWQVRADHEDSHEISVRGRRGTGRRVAPPARSVSLPP